MFVWTELGKHCFGASLGAARLDDVADEIADKALRFSCSSILSGWLANEFAHETLGKN